MSTRAFRAGRATARPARALPRTRSHELRQIKATGVADATCQQSSGYRERLVTARCALEQEYVDAHKADLDALLSTAGVER
ncbi:hypothetical protein QUV83_17135 [Cellulomonas cellasea]|uniref:hypothetical protein n=1 Tax=Cellulomonas cellasea TaxID=43670 RepID=UPI0025A466D2|nr:hypothetical protein [Cellulomonas cellasea]MDM8086500.1 hypothetical protein [Cellulomonas cellasea]